MVLLLVNCVLFGLLFISFVVLLVVGGILFVFVMWFSLCLGKLCDVVEWV